MQIVITKCEEQGSHPTHKEFLVVGTVDGEVFSVTVMPFCSEYHYECFPSTLNKDDDEPLQVAIGQHFEDHSIDVGRVGR